MSACSLVKCVVHLAIKIEFSVSGSGSGKHLHIYEVDICTYVYMDEAEQLGQACGLASILFSFSIPIPIIATTTAECAIYDELFIITNCMRSKDDE